MKRYLKISIAVILSLLFAANASAVTLYDLIQGAVAVYGFEGNIDNQLGTGNDGEGFGVEFSDEGVRNTQAILLDGDGSFVDLGENINFEYNEPFSLNIWVKRYSLGEGVLLSKRANKKGKAGWELRLNHKNELIFELASKYKSEKIEVKTENQYENLHYYYHIIATYDGSGSVNGLKIYVDGKQQTVKEWDGQSDIAASILTDAHLNIGARDNAAKKKPATFHGLIDSVGFWAKHFSEEEVAIRYEFSFIRNNADDADSDGVIDQWDRCANTPLETAVDKYGCEAVCQGSDDAVSPFNPSILINNGDEITHSTTVSVSLSADDNVGVIAYLLSEDATQPSEWDSRWTNVVFGQQYSDTVEFGLDGSGDGILYAWFKDTAGNVSQTVSDSIGLEVSDLYLAEDYFITQNGHGIRYVIKDYAHSLEDIYAWAVVQNVDNYRFQFTLNSETKWKLDNSLGGAFNLDTDEKVVRFYAGMPSGNQGNFYGYFALPSEFYSGDQYEDGQYKVEHIGSQVVNGIFFPDCIKISFTHPADFDYLNGEGYFLLARGIGIVKLYFKRTESQSEVTFEYLDHNQFEKHTFAGNVVKSGVPAEGLHVQTSNMLWITNNVTDSAGAFSLQAYGPDIILRVGEDADNDGIFDFETSDIYNYWLNGITSDMTDLVIDLDVDPYQ